MSLPLTVAVSIGQKRLYHVILETWSNAARDVNIKGISGSGAPFEFQQATNSDRSIATKTKKFPSDGLTLLAASLIQTGVRRGECYVRCYLSTSPNREGLVGYFFAGYVSDQEQPSWPPGKIESSIEGSGLLRILVGTDPAAAVEITETVPTNARWKLRALTASLGTSADAGSRQPALLADDAVNTAIRVRQGTTQAASDSVSWSWVMGVTKETALVGGAIAAEWPDLPMLQGFRVLTSTVAFDTVPVADNWGAPVMLVEEWIEE